MNILHVIPDLSPASGGPVTAVWEMSEAQAQLGHKVSIVSTDIGYRSEDASKNIEIKLFRSEFPQWRWSSQLARGIEPLIKSSDIVHLHTVWDHPVLAAAAVCRKLGKPYILRPCGMLDAWSLSQRAWKKKFYLFFNGKDLIKNPSAIHFTSSSESQNSKLPETAEKGFIAPLGVSEFFYKSFTDGSLVGKYPQLLGKQKILFLSRLHYKKQPEVVIDAFKVLSEKHRDIFLIIAGDGDAVYVDNLKRKVSSLGIDKKVIFTGILNRESCRAAYAEASIFVLPSFQENFGLSVLEAMAAGCPVVVSHQVALASMIQKAEAGFTCDATADSLIAAVQRLLVDEGLRKRMGENGRQLAQEEFSWEKSATALQAVYEDILAGHYRSSAWIRRKSQ